ncbi:MAG: insulinase family protein [Firmicutes bacterium]|nr:insulinase family protein [Bacillota bacterium]
MEVIRDRVNLYIDENKKFKGFYLCICMHQPLNEDTVTKNRLLSLVLSSGCEMYKTQTELNTALAECDGAQLSIQSVKKGDRIILQFLIAAPKGSEEEQFRILSEIMDHPYLKADDFAVSRKKHLKNIIENKIADKKNYAYDRCMELMFEKTGFGIDGDGILRDLCGIRDLYGYYRQLYENSQTDVFILGDISRERAEQLLKKYFPNLKSKNIKRGTASAAEYKTVVERSKGKQAKLCIGIDMGEGSRFEKMVFNELLGVGSSSRLFRTVREKNGLCYYISSTYLSLANAVFIQAGIDEENFEKTVGLIKEQLYKPPESDEIKSARASVTDTLKILGDYPVALMDFYLTQGIFGDGVTVEEAIKRIDKVDKISLDPKISVVYLLGGEEVDN